MGEDRPQSERRATMGRIIGALTSRIPAIGTPQEPPGVPETVSEPVHREEGSESPETANAFYTAIGRATTDLIPALIMAFRALGRLATLFTTLFKDFLSAVVTAIGLAFALFIAVLGFTASIISAAGVSIPATFASIVSAFASIGSSLTGDQVVTIVSAIIGVIGSIISAFLTATLTRGARNRR